MDGPTLEFYETRGEEWSATHPLATQSARLDSFLDLLPPGATILELGCGDGRDAQHMIARGFAVHPSDGSPAMAALASRRLGREVPVMRFAELDAVEAFDAAWCQATLLHAPENELPGLLLRIHRALRPGGWHWASFKGGQGGGRDPFGRFFSYLPRRARRGRLSCRRAWAEFGLTSGDGTSYGGAPTRWHNVLARKRAGRYPIASLVASDY